MLHKRWCSRVAVCLLIVERTLVYYAYSAHPFEFARSITIEFCKCIFGDTIPSETHPAHSVWRLYKSRTRNIILVALFFSQEVITSGSAFHVGINRSPGDTRSQVAIILLATKQFTMRANCSEYLSHTSVLNRNKCWYIVTNFGLLTQSSELLLLHWDNPMISYVLVDWPRRIWVTTNSSKPHHYLVMHCMRWKLFFFWGLLMLLCLVLSMCFVPLKQYICCLAVDNRVMHGYGFYRGPIYKHNSFPVFLHRVYNNPSQLFQAALNGPIWFSPKHQN